MVANVVLHAARTDPNAFVEYIHGFEQAAIHERMQDWWTLHRDSATEEHRGIGKTIQATTRIAWEIGRRPDIRIKYVQQSDEEAKKSVKLIKHILESRRYSHVFPRIEPDADQWGKQQLSVMAPGVINRDATLEAKGIFGNAGGRWDLIVFDDICDLRNSVQNPALREQVKEAYANTWLPMADPTRATPPRIIRVCTPYHVEDITADWRRIHGERGTLLRDPVVNMQSPWPEVFTPDVLADRREEMGPVAFARAYELRPVSSEVLIFPAEWLDASMYEGDIPAGHFRRGRFIATVDFAFTEKKLDNDPDYSICLIGWHSSQGHIWLVDMIRSRSSFPQFKRQVIEACNRWKVQSVKAEGNGPQRGLVQQMNTDAPFPVTSVERDRDKVTRAADRQSFVESGRFHIKAETRRGKLLPTATFQPLYDEMTTFPAGGHDDTVDAAIDIMDVRQHTSTSPVSIKTPDRMRMTYGVGQ